MIYAEKKQEETGYVSVNTITRGRVLQPEKITKDTASYQAKKEQSRAPALNLQEEQTPKVEAEPDSEK